MDTSTWEFGICPECTSMQEMLVCPVCKHCEWHCANPEGCPFDNSNGQAESVKQEASKTTVKPEI